MPMKVTGTWRAAVLAGYGLVLAGLGVFARAIGEVGTPAQAPVVLMGYVQLALAAIVIPLEVTAPREGSRIAFVRGVFLRVALFLAAGVPAVLVVTMLAGSSVWPAALRVQAVVWCYAVGALGVSVLVLAVLRRGVLSQWVVSVVLLTMLGAPLVANPLIEWAGPGRRARAIDCVSYSSGMVMVSYAGGMDFYRGPRMYEWSLAGDYPYHVPLSLIHI